MPSPRGARRWRPPTCPRRLLPAAPPRRAWLAAAGVALVVFGARLAEVHFFASDVPYNDQWVIEAQQIIAPWLNGTLGPGDFFIPHFEHLPVVDAPAGVAAGRAHRPLGPARADDDQRRVLCRLRVARRALDVVGAAVPCPRPRSRCCCCSPAACRTRGKTSRGVSNPNSRSRCWPCSSMCTAAARSRPAAAAGGRRKPPASRASSRSPASGSRRWPWSPRGSGPDRGGARTCWHPV